MKKKAYLCGVLTGALIFGAVPSFAANGVQSLAASFQDIKIYINEQLIQPKDAAGNAVEPFIVEGSTYLPIRAIAEALGQEVGWDNGAKAVYIGTQPASLGAQAQTQAPAQTAAASAFDFDKVVVVDTLAEYQAAVAAAMEFPDKVRVITGKGFDEEIEANAADFLFEARGWNNGNQAYWVAQKGFQYASQASYTSRPDVIEGIEINKQMGRDAYLSWEKALAMIDEYEGR
jgi:hypothetical protein